MKPTHSRYTPVRTIILGSIAALLVLVACESKLPTSAEISTMDVAAMEKRAAEAQLLAEPAADGGRQVGIAPPLPPGSLARPLVYIVDGKAVSDKEAHAIPAGAIASVEVSKAHGNEPAEILVTTKAAASADDSQNKFHDERVAFTKRSATLTDTGYATLRGRIGGAGTDGGAMKTFTGVLFIDGVRSTQAQMAALSKGDILSVEVVKGPNAMQEVDDPAAANGVIRIKTKRANP